MDNINIILFYADNLSLDILNTLFIIAGLLGIYVIITNNPILSVLFLIGLIFIIAIYLILIGLHFIGLSYLLIYVGAISMLFLFILMLINIRVSELFANNKNSLLLAILTVLAFNFSINDLLPQDIYLYTIYSYDILTFITNSINNLLSFQFIINIYDYSIYNYKYLLFNNVVNVGDKSWDSTVFNVTHISSLGNVLYTNLFILSVVISMILLLAMVGAIIITINNKSFKNVFSSPSLPQYVSTRLNSAPLIPYVSETDLLIEHANYLFAEGLSIQILFMENEIESDQLQRLHGLVSFKYSNENQNIYNKIFAFQKKYYSVSRLCADNDVQMVRSGPIHNIVEILFVKGGNIFNPLLEGEKVTPIGKPKDGIQGFKDLYTILQRDGRSLTMRFNEIYRMFPYHDKIFMDLYILKKAANCPDKELSDLALRHLSRLRTGRPIFNAIAEELENPESNFRKVFPNGWPRQWE